MLEIVQAVTARNIELVRGLLEEYGAWGVAEGIAFPEEYKAFQEQLSNLPGSFGPPDGCLLAAIYDGDAAGCVAMRKLSDDVCEMKRLYVRTKFRRLGIGKALAEAIIEQARGIGYTRMRLDTVASMKAARALYTALGFKEIEPYRYNPLEGAVFMELSLV
jgi:ribosomal protein S18 acetylase RimI-like enzyme